MEIEEIKKRKRVVEKPENAGKVICEFEENISTKRKNIVQLAYQQGIIFQKFKERETFSKVDKQIWSQQVDNLL